MSLCFSLRYHFIVLTYFTLLLLCHLVSSNLLLILFVGALKLHFLNVINYFALFKNYYYINVLSTDYVIHLLLKNNPRPKNKQINKLWCYHWNFNVL